MVQMVSDDMVHVCTHMQVLACTPRTGAVGATAAAPRAPRPTRLHSKKSLWLPSPLPPLIVPPSAELLSGAGDRADSPADQSQATTFAAASAPGRETADAQGERLLHIALPWVFGQRVLAMMAREDARSVDSDGSEPLPAYEPREQGQGDRL